MHSTEESQPPVTPPQLPRPPPSGQGERYIPPETRTRAQLNGPKEKNPGRNQPLSSSPPTGPRGSRPTLNKGKQPEGRRSGPGRGNSQPRRSGFNGSSGPRRSPINRQQQLPTVHLWDERNKRPQPQSSRASNNNKKKNNPPSHVQSSPTRPAQPNTLFCPPIGPKAMRGQTAPPQGKTTTAMRRLDTPILDAMSDEQHDKHISSTVKELKQEMMALGRQVASLAARQSRGSGRRRR